MPISKNTSDAPFTHCRLLAWDIILFPQATGYSSWLVKQVRKETPTKVNLNHILEELWLLLNESPQLDRISHTFCCAAIFQASDKENQNQGGKRSVKSVLPTRVSPRPVSAPSTREQQLFWKTIFICGI